MKSIYFGWIVPIIVFCLSATIHAQDSSDEWKLEVVKDGVSVYTRAMVGSRILESKAEIMIQKNVEDLVELYLNPEKCPDWFTSCRTAKLLEKKSKTNVIVYREISIPWPFKNQDYVLDLNISRTVETGEVIVEFSDLEDYPIETKCCRRYKAMNGFWKFTPADDHVFVTYQVHFVPGGNFPASAINQELPGMLVETLTSLKINAGI